MSDHTEFVAAHKAELEEQTEGAMKEDLSAHEERLKKALKTKEKIIADKREMLAQGLQIEHTWHENMKEIEKHEKEKDVNWDTQMHAAHMEHAAHPQEEMAVGKRHMETERLERTRRVH